MKLWTQIKNTHWSILTAYVFAATHILSCVIMLMMPGPFDLQRFVTQLLLAALWGETGVLRQCVIDRDLTIRKMSGLG